jgi:histidinol-phosphatase
VSIDDICLSTALAAARQASNFIAKRFGNPQSCRLKEDRSAVTETDVDVEQLIKRIIKEQHPSHGFLGEERGRATGSEDFTWVVDPIDGTKNFVRGIPLFSVEIALVKAGIPHIGVSSLPVFGETLWAIRGKGAHSAGGSISVSTVSHLNDAYLSFGNLKHFARQGLLNHLTALASTVFQSRGFGDSWSFHLLSSGKLDAFVDAKTAFWDIAALTVIVEEAGGIVSDIEGRPIDEKSTSVVAANAHLHSLVLEHFHDGRVGIETGKRAETNP